MKTIPLRTLLREPLKVKKMTRRGEVIQITDKGEALWVLKAAEPSAEDEAERIRAIDELMDEVLRSKPSPVSAVKLLLESRR